MKFKIYIIVIQLFVTVTNLSDVFGVQLILATVPANKELPAPKIVTDENLQLLFDIQEKVWRDSSFKFSWLSVIMFYFLC